MSATLAITDSMDGSGGVATITGGGGGDTNTLYRATWTGQTGVLTWTLVGSRTGNGSISIDVDPGFYAFRLVNSATAGNQIVYQPLTDADEQSILERSLESIVNRIDGLNLPDVGTIDFRWLPRAKQGDDFPIIAVVPVNGESFPGVMTGTDDIGLPIAVVHIDKANQDPKANISRNLLHRQRILSALRFQRLAGVSEGYILNPESGIIVDPSWFNDANMLFSPLFFRLMTRTVRG